MKQLLQDLNSHAVEVKDVPSPRCAVGGVLVAALGTGTAFALDAATFGVSAVCIALMQALPVARSDEGASVIDDLKEGARFVRQNTWLWATLLSAALPVRITSGWTAMQRAMQRRCCCPPDMPKAFSSRRSLASSPSDALRSALSTV